MGVGSILVHRVSSVRVSRTAHSEGNSATGKAYDAVDLLVVSDDSPSLSITLFSEPEALENLYSRANHAVVKASQHQAEVERDRANDLLSDLRDATTAKQALIRENRRLERRVAELDRQFEAARMTADSQRRRAERWTGAAERLHIAITKLAAAKKSEDLVEIERLMAERDEAIRVISNLYEAEEIPF